MVRKRERPYPERTGDDSDGDLLSRRYYDLSDSERTRRGTLLHYHGVCPKGKGLKPEWIEEMKAHDVPQWYIDSCLKIKYMFPKAHAAAYVMMAWRVAYCKGILPAGVLCGIFQHPCEWIYLQADVPGAR